MKTGRRSFFKILGTVVGGLTFGRRVRAMDADQYVQKFQENSVPIKPTTVKGWSGIAVSGYYGMTGRVPLTLVSGRYEYDPTRQ